MDKQDYLWINMIIIVFYFFGKVLNLYTTPPPSKNINTEQNAKKNNGY